MLYCILYIVCLSLFFTDSLVNSYSIISVRNHRQIATPFSIKTQFSRIYARVAKNDGDEKQESSENMVTIPFDGLVGGERGKLFDDPVEVYDPIKNTEDLPGEDGSEEKINAIMQRIDERVQALKRSGEWDSEGDNFSSNPLAYQPLWQTMIMQVKACKPFESYDELVLTYLLMLFTTVLLAGYLVLIRDSLNDFMLWFTGSDFDSEFIDSVMKNVSV